jgi:NAD(P)-dependent dehydrogenase (short-subunit alcohol dehydrogenase family)
MRQIRNRKALVTGAASGIGRALALRLAREGCDLYLLDIDLPQLAQTAAAAREHGVEVITSRCDLSCSDDISACNAALLAHWGRLDILVNNAGVVYYGPTEDMTSQQWQWLLAINLLAPIQFVRELMPVLRDRPESHVVLMASICGLVAASRVTAYNVSKFGLVGLGASLRAEYGRQGVGVTTVCPGFVSTHLFDAAICGYARRPRFYPPSLLQTSPEHVADCTIRAIYRDQRLVLITPMAHLLYQAQRFAPGLLDLLQRLGRHRRLAKKALRHATGDPLPVSLPLPQWSDGHRRAA